MLIGRRISSSRRLNSKAGELIHQARVELTDTQRDLSSLQKQRLLMVERLRASLRMFERMLEVEEQEAFHDAATASEEKLEGESSPTIIARPKWLRFSSQARSKLLRAVLSTAASFPTSDRFLAYGYPSRHSNGAAIGR